MLQHRDAPLRRAKHTPVSRSTLPKNPTGRYHTSSIIKLESSSRHFSFRDFLYQSSFFKNIEIVISIVLKSSYKPDVFKCLKYEFLKFLWNIYFSSAIKRLRHFCICSLYFKNPTIIHDYFHRYLSWAFKRLFFQALIQPIWCINLDLCCSIPLEDDPSGQIINGLVLRLAFLPNIGYNISIEIGSELFVVQWRTFNFILAALSLTISEVCQGPGSCWKIILVLLGIFAIDCYSSFCNKL